jgi:PPOX class probable F420-dependent enzyme
MIDLNHELNPHEQDRLVREPVIWLTTVRKDGLPMPTPVWFLWTGRDFLVYSIPGQQKLKNIEGNRHVSLHLNCDEWGGEVIIILGEAEVSPGNPPAIKNDAYLEKYRNGIKDIQMTNESFSDQYHIAIRIEPTKVRHW